MPGVRLHLLIYAILVMSIISDLVTTAACFQANDGIKETNLFYNYFGFWAFPLVLCLDALIVLVIEWLRKYVRWNPIIPLILIVAYLKAGVTNLILLLSI